MNVSVDPYDLNRALRDGLNLNIPGGGGIPEAPIDGQLYGRENATWVLVPAPGGIPEAPVDGTYYSRFNASWSHLSTANGATTGLLTSADWTTFNSKQPPGSYLTSVKSTKEVFLCAAFTPALTGADAAEVMVPYATDGSSLTYNVNRIWLRASIAGGSPSVTIEKSTGAGVFSAVAVGTVTLGAGAYEGSVTAALGTVASADKLRFNVLALGAAQNWTISVEIAAQ